MPITVMDSATALARANAMDRAFLAPLRPALIGPRAGLHRFAVLTERGAVGAYDPLNPAAYDYPDQTAASTVDLTTVKLFADAARLNYFNKYVGVNGSCQPSNSYTNRVRAANFVFKTANGTARTAVFGDRDVAVGDVVVVRGNDGGTVTVDTVVTGFVGEPVAAVTAAATADAANKATQTLSAAISQVDGTPLNEVAATANGAAYASSADGYITRTYTVTVTTSSTGSDATTGRLRVRSADGLDDQDDVVPAAFASPTAVGTKGLTVTWSLAGSPSSAAIDQVDFVVGQQWTVTVAQAFTQPVATSAGTYTGTRDDTYIVAVSRGGLYTDTLPPQITVTTANGSDSSGPTSVTAAATPVAAGTYGVTVAFSGTQLRKGDSYYVVVTAAAEGAVKTLVLRDDVPASIRATEVDLRLFVARNGVEVPLTRTLPSPGTNWAFTADGVTTQAGVYLTDAEFTAAGAAVGVALDSATLYVEYREWLTAGAGDVLRLNTRASVAAALGTVDPLNPLAYAVDIALKNTYTEVTGDATVRADLTTDIVYAVALGGDPADAALWTTALQAFEEDEQIYSVVLLSSDPAVQALGKTHVLAQSADADGFYRRLFVPAVLTETAAVVAAGASVDDLGVTATIAATAGTSPTKYTTVTVSANAGLVTRGARAGDVLRTNYGTDSTGAETYDSYPIASVISETTVVLASGPAAAVTVARRAEVWRVYTKSELVAQLIASAAAYASDRVHYVWPDHAGLGGETLAGSYVCAAVAGLAGSLPSHQGLRNVQLAGLDDVSRASRFFTAAHLKAMAAGGVFVVSQTPAGVVYVRSAVSTDPTDVVTREEMIGRNGDMIRKGIQAAWAPYIGSGNVLSMLRSYLDAALQRMVFRLRAGTYALGLGTPVGNLNLTALDAVVGQADTIQATIAVTGIAVPLNMIRINFPVTID